MGGSSRLVFHRNYLETTALFVATHSHLIWSTLRMILYPIGRAAHQQLQLLAAYCSLLQPLGAPHNMSQPLTVASPYPPLPLRRRRRAARTCLSLHAGRELALPSEQQRAAELLGPRRTRQPGKQVSQ